MSHQQDFKLINNSGGQVGPINLLDIFGPCDAEPQVVTLEDGEEVAFCGKMDDVDAQMRLEARLKELGTKLGYGGVVLDIQPIMDATPQPDPPDPEPLPTEPPDEAD